MISNRMVARWSQSYSSTALKLKSYNSFTFTKTIFENPMVVSFSNSANFSFSEQTSKGNSDDDDNNQQNKPLDIQNFTEDLSKIADILLPDSMKSSSGFAITKNIANRMIHELEKSNLTSNTENNSPGDINDVSRAIKHTVDVLENIQLKRGTAASSSSSARKRSHGDSEAPVNDLTLEESDSEAKTKSTDSSISTDEKRQPETTQVFEPDIISSPSGTVKLNNDNSSTESPFDCAVEQDNTIYSDTDHFFIDSIMPQRGKQSNTKSKSNSLGDFSDSSASDMEFSDVEESDSDSWHGKYKTLAEQKHSLLETLRPQDIVDSLTKYIIGQQEAKKMVAVALRNRWRRHLLPPEIQKEVMPKNILMLGPTGSGKTEIARRLANLAGAPFIITQATTLTEVGYHGRDVDMIIRDLVEVGMHLAKVNLAQEAVKPGTKAHYKVTTFLINALLKSPKFSRNVKDADSTEETTSNTETESKEPELSRTPRLSRKEIRTKLNNNEYDDIMINVFDFPQEIVNYTKKYEEFGPTSQTGPDMFTTSSQPSSLGGMGFDPMSMGNMSSIIFPIGGSQEGNSPLSDLIRSISGDPSFKQRPHKSSGKTKKKKHNLEKKLSEMRQIIEEFVGEKSLDPTRIRQEALRSVEQDGIVFLDELDKICESRKGSSSRGADPSSEGVQRDLLPLIEGSTVSTRYGNVKTHHILFIGAGAFHSTSPSDLLPELQGRLPCRVELKALTKDDLLRILTDTENSLIKQNVALFATEGVELKFTDDAIHEIAVVSAEINSTVEDIGARRLITVIERLLEDHSFHACEKKGETVEITANDVRETIGLTVLKTDLSRFII